MAAPNLSEILTTTLRNRSGKLRDAVTKNTALLYKLKEKGRSRPFSGGRTIVEEIEYGENTTFLRYNGYEPLNIRPSEIVTAAEYNIKQAAIAVTISGLEELQNSGAEQIIDLMEMRITNAEKTFLNRLAEDSYSDGTATGGKQIGGLRTLVSDSGVGTVGGINATDWDFWKNAVASFTSMSLGTPSATNIQTAMNNLYVKLVRNRESPDLIIADNVFYLLYLSSLQSIQRIQNAKLADAGFKNLEYMGVPVVLDGGMSGSAPASHMYFLNTDYIHWRPHKDRNIVPLGGDRQAVNQDAIVKLMAWAGNMTTSNRMMSGVLVA